MPDESISKVSEGFRTTAVLDKVTPSLPVGTLLAIVAELDETNNAAVPPPTEPPDRDELMDDSDIVVSEPLAETVAPTNEETVALVVNGWPAVVEIYGPDEATLLSMMSLPDDAKLTVLSEIITP